MFIILLRFQKCDSNKHGMAYHNIESLTDIAAGLIGLITSTGLYNIPYKCVREKIGSGFAAGLTYTLAVRSLLFAVFACNQVAICLLARHRHEQIAKHDKYDQGQKPMRRMVKYCASVWAVHILLAVLAVWLNVTDQNGFSAVAMFALLSYQGPISLNRKPKPKTENRAKTKSFCFTKPKPEPRNRNRK